MCPQRHTKFYFPYPISLNFQRNLIKNPWSVEHTKGWLTLSLLLRSVAVNGCRMRDARCKIQDVRESLLIPYPESRIQNPVSRIQNPESCIGSVLRNIRLSMIRRIKAYQGPATNLRASTVTPGVMT